jgi:hypothetical protein
MAAREDVLDDFIETGKSEELFLNEHLILCMNPC